MSGPVLLRGARLAELDPVRVQLGDLRLVDGFVAERGVGLEPGDAEVVDCDGDLVMPGLVNAHTHLYSALSLGLPCPAVEGFEEALDRIWWPLDRALTTAHLAPSARAGLLTALRCGCTTVLDHHASPSAIEGSLAALAEGYREVGVRGALCYETTDRNGPGEGERGIAENRAGVARWTGGHLRALIGLHASFTLEDATLAGLADVPGPIHVHVAEGEGDVADARRRGARGVLQRLDAFGLLRPGSILAHGVHLGPDEVDLAEERGCWLLHNPTSNRNNRVGYARPGRFHRSGLGTDGIGSDMLGAFQEAFFSGREHRHEVDLLALLNGSQRLASELLGVPLGRLEVGYAADLVRLRDLSPTPLNADNLVGHLLFGLGARQVRDVWVAGERRLADGRVVGLDEQAVAADCREAAADLWERYLKEL